MTSSYLAAVFNVTTNRLTGAVESFIIFRIIKLRLIESITRNPGACWSPACPPWCHEDGGHCVECKLEAAPPTTAAAAAVLRAERQIHSSCGRWKFWHLKPLTNQSVCVLSLSLRLHSERGDNLSALSVWCTVITCDLFNREPAVSLIWPSVRGRTPPPSPQSGRCLKSNCGATMLRCARPLRP